MSRSFRARPLDNSRQLELITDIDLLDSQEGLPARDVVHNHAALDADNEKVCLSRGGCCSSRHSGRQHLEVGQQLLAAGAAAVCSGSSSSSSWTPPPLTLPAGPLCPRSLR